MKRLLLFFFALFVLLSCQREIVPKTAESLNNNNDIEVLTIRGRKVRARKLTNPYGIENMRQAYAAITGQTKSEGDPDPLEPNCYYVKIFVTEPGDIAFLDSLDVDVFDEPLDYEIFDEPEIEENPGGSPGGVSQSSSGASGREGANRGGGGEEEEIEDDQPEDEEEITGDWVYAVVDSLSVIPLDITYELLEECYVPDECDDEGEGIELTRSMSTGGSLFAELLEREAILRADLPEGFGLGDDVGTKSSSQSPTGYIRVRNNDFNTDVPVKGVRVKCNYFVKIAHTYTDANGYYSFVGKKKWSCNPYYHLKYVNTKNFEIWGRLPYVAPTRISFGKHSKSGYNHTFGTSEIGWRYSIINNSAFDYYEMCADTGITNPPSGLKIWCLGNLVDWSSAPMLKHMTDSIVHSFFENIAPDFLTNTLGLVGIAYLRSILPDVFIGTASSSLYHKVYCATWHELSHCSHFQRVGSVRWGTYISHIVTSWISKHGMYGDASTCNDNSTGGAGLCGISESWAYAYETVAGRTFHYSYSNGNQYWFSSNKDILVTLITSSILTPAQVFAVMTPSIYSISDFRSALISTYPQQADAINLVISNILGQ